MRTIDMTPTWTEAARMLVFIMENANETGKEQARKEIMRMGEIIDAFKAQQKDEV
jgi:hypothetical protein